MKLLYALLLTLSVACAYGQADTETYGHRAPEAWDGGSPAPGFTDPNVNDPYYTLCFWQEDQSSGTIEFVYVCDGQPFNVNDIVDPDPGPDKRNTR